MTDLSTDKPVITQWSEGWWAQARPEVAAHRCAAHRKNGDRCRRAALSGATVCDHHGANRSVRAKARQRLEDAADRMARELLGIATDKSASESVRLTAIRDALDRAGLRPPTEIAVSAGTKPYEQIFDSIYHGPRAAREDDEPPPALAESHVSKNGIEIVDAEVVEPEPDRTDVPPRASAERANSAGRRTYTIRDFERS